MLKKLCLLRVARVDNRASPVRLLAGVLLLFAVCAAHARPVMTPDIKAGELLFWANCAACHEAGLRHAPLIGNKAMWAPRVAKGEAALLHNAIHGLNKMPPRGGKPELSDEELLRIVRYMIFMAGDVQ